MRFFLLLFIISTAVYAQPTGTRPPIEAETLVFPVQGEHVHGSSVVELPNGDLLAAWFQGSGERTSDDVRIMGARFKNGKWSAPFLMADTPYIPDCNPVLFLNHARELFLVWIAVQANRWEHSVLRVRTTTDYGGEGAPRWTWQDNILLKPDDTFATEIETQFRSLPSPGHGWAEYAPSYPQMITEAARDAGKRSFGWMTRIKPLLLPEGRIVLPLYSDGFNLSLMAVSDDDGRTWKPGLPLVGYGPIQPALALKKDGTLAAYMRDSGDAPNRVHYSESKDQGQSWTASVKTGIPNTASVEVLTLKNGLWVFVGNDITRSRSRLSLYVSDDEGKTWKWKHLLEDREKGNYSYPALIQSADGRIHITYSYHPEHDKKTIKHVQLKPESLTR